MIRLIIYDLDGTLIDSRLDIAEAVNGTLREMDLGELPVERISRFVGNGVRNLMTQVLKEATPQATGGKTCALPPLERTIKIFRRRYGEHLLDRTCLYPSVKRVLEHFKMRKQAVITNKPEDFSKTILQGLGIDSYFFQIIGGDAGFPKKPSPETVLEILSRGRVSGNETVLVGDSATDIETGRNAGVKTVAVTYGFGQREEIGAAKPDFILDDLSDLLDCPLLLK